MRHVLTRMLLLVFLAAFALLLVRPPLGHYGDEFRTFKRFAITPLVTNEPGWSPFEDDALVNPWGMVQGMTGELWTANNGTGTAGAFELNGRPTGPLVTIPAPLLGEQSAPTGVVFNPYNDAFFIGRDGFFAPAREIFATESGTIAGYNPEVDFFHAILEVIEIYDDGGNAREDGRITKFKGLAIAKDYYGDPFLYATDFTHNQVRVYDANWDFVGYFTDPFLPEGYAPFGIQNIDGLLFVTFARRNPETDDDVPGIGNGYVDIFDVDGFLLARFASEGPLNSPWGLAKAPLRFSGVPNAILVGNFGDGRINVYSPKGDFLGQLGDEWGAPITIPGLWTLLFLVRPEPGHFPSLFDMRNPSLFFTAGGPFEEDGLLGRITPIKVVAPGRPMGSRMRR